MRVLVVTVVHTPLDARIRRRQIGSLLDRGCQVALAAPWRAYGVTPPVGPGLRAIELPRARGRRRLAALFAAGRLLRRHGGAADVVILHDPELLFVSRFVPRGPVVVWDVHEDGAASLVDRPWVPRAARSLARGLLRRLERAAEAHHRLLLAETGYASRFAEDHPVVRNVPPVPDTRPHVSPRDAVVYVGRISVLRGSDELLALGPKLSALGVELVLIGAPDASVEPALRAAHERGELTWHGYLPNEEALQHVDGALAGLSLLHDVPNYRVSAPTKVYEYLSRGVPVITTPLPLPQELVEEHRVGRVVGFGDVDAVVRTIVEWREDPVGSRERGVRAHELAQRDHNWTVEGARFVSQLQAWVDEPRP